MNKYSKNVIGWGIITIIYFLAMCEVNSQGYAGWIAILMFIPFIIGLIFTIAYIPKADIFVMTETEEDQK